MKDRKIPNNRRPGRLKKGPSRKDETTLAKLRELTEEQVNKAWFAAESAGRVHQPNWLRSLWDRRMKGRTREGVSDLVAIMRKGLGTPEIDDPAKAATHLAILLRMAVERFQSLVAGGVMDDALQALNALPLLYSATAGNGASKWTWAHSLFKAKKVGTLARTQHTRGDAMEGRTQQWRCLAEDAVNVALWASLHLQELDALRSRAVAASQFDFRRLRASYGVTGIFYLLDDKSVLLWPEWLEECSGLPVNVSEAIPRYKSACLALAKEFFGDVYNKHAEHLLQPLLKKNEKQHGKNEGRARMEAAKMVAAAVGRLGGEK